MVQIRPARFDSAASVWACRRVLMTASLPWQRSVSCAASSMVLCMHSRRQAYLIGVQLHCDYQEHGWLH